MSEDALDFDAVVVGGGVAGLACAIRLAQGGAGVMVLEKSARAGGHLLSGAVMRTEALEKLLGAEGMGRMPLKARVAKEGFYGLLGGKASVRLPFVPPKMRMEGLPMVSVSELGAALAKEAEAAGAEVVTGQTVDGLLWEGERVAGVRSGGEEIRARWTVLADGPAGVVTQEALARCPGAAGENPMSYALGIKELVELAEDDGRAGEAMHTFGHPLPWRMYGGGFVYHLDGRHVALGLAMALDDRDAGLNAHELFRAWKRHPRVQEHVAGGTVAGYGARLVPEGGWFSAVRGTVPGAKIVGDAAGWVDGMELKGLHLAVESGVAAAEAVLKGEEGPGALPASAEGMRKTRNYRAGFRWGVPMGMGLAGMAWVTGGALPPGRWQLREERGAMRPLKGAGVEAKGDGAGVDAGLDRDLFAANLKYREGGEGHIRLKDAEACRRCAEVYGAPCTRFCPAGVYERGEDGTMRVRRENCLQCRTCRLKCPMDAIEWVTPQGGDGPDYKGM